MQANTTPVSPDDVIYPRSDEAEAKQLVEMYGASEGIGDIILTEEEKDILSDLGFKE